MIVGGGLRQCGSPPIPVSNVLTLPHINNKNIQTSPLLEKIGALPQNMVPQFDSVIRGVPLRFP